MDHQRRGRRQRAADQSPAPVAEGTEITCHQQLPFLAHHDDHVLWMGGAIQRLVETGWKIKVVAMCVPDPQRRDYFDDTCSALAVTSAALGFAAYMGPGAFSRNDRGQMRNQLLVFPEVNHGLMMHVVKITR